MCGNLLQQSIVLFLLVALSPSGLKAVDPFAFPMPEDATGGVLFLELVSEKTWFSDCNFATNVLGSDLGFSSVRLYLDADNRRSHSKILDLVEDIAGVLEAFPDTRFLCVRPGSSTAKRLLCQIVDYEVESQKRLRAIGHTLFGVRSKARHLWRLLFNTIVAIRRTARTLRSTSPSQKERPWRSLSREVHAGRVRSQGEAISTSPDPRGRPWHDLSQVGSAVRTRGYSQGAVRDAEVLTPLRPASSAFLAECPDVFSSTSPPPAQSRGAAAFPFERQVTASSQSAGFSVLSSAYAGVAPGDRRTHRRELRMALRKIRTQFPYVDQTSVWGELLEDAGSCAPSLKLDLFEFPREPWRQLDTVVFQNISYPLIGAILPLLHQVQHLKVDNESGPKLQEPLQLVFADYDRLQHLDLSYDPFLFVRDYSCMVENYPGNEADHTPRKVISAPLFFWRVRGGTAIPAKGHPLLSINSGIESPMEQRMQEIFANLPSHGRNVRVTFFGTDSITALDCGGLPISSNMLLSILQNDLGEFDPTVAWKDRMTWGMKFAELEYLDLSDTNVHTLAQLTHLKRLRVLDLRGTRIADPENVRFFPRLEVIRSDLFTQRPLTWGRSELSFARFLFYNALKRNHDYLFLLGFWAGLLLLIWRVNDSYGT